MRVLVACDSFKDALPATEVCSAIAQGLRAGHADAEIVQMPLADGGEGSLQALTAPMGLRMQTATVANPLMRPVAADWGLSADGRTAVLEMAQAAGLQRLALWERDPEATSTWGVGQLIAAAVALGAQRVILAVGGSATTDGGVGAAAALGWRFLDAQGDELRPCGGALLEIARIVAPARPLALRVEVICDVDNPLLGPFGAAWAYGRQKGGTDPALARLDAGLANLAQVAEAQLGRRGLADIPGAGAAGGLAFGAMAFFGGTLSRGVDVVLDAAGFDQAAAASDLVVTGEGRLDGQTLHGKLIEGVCRRARAAGVPVIALCGSVSASTAEVEGLNLKAAYPINDGSGPLASRIARTADDLHRTAMTLRL